MKNKTDAIPYIMGAVVSLVFLGVSFFLFCPAIHIKNVGLWLLINGAVFLFVYVVRRTKGCKDLGLVTVVIQKTPKSKPKKRTELRCNLKPYAASLVLLALTALVALVGAPMFNAVAYSQILTVKESDFVTDLAESVGTDSIALMDTASAQMLGDREIGSLSDVVSQYDVSMHYTQIDYQGKPIKVAPLDHVDFFKWTNNRARGVGGYVSVDPVSMTASFHNTDGMKYVPSAFLDQDAFRHIRMRYPTLMLDDLHFEIDEEGKPFYIVSVVDHTIALFGGKTVTGCIILDPVTGETSRYALEDIPRWVDMVFDGDLICEQYNWYGMYSNGFANSLFAKKGCKQVTTYHSGEADGEESSDATPVSDYGYIAKDGDIWIYTGVTSVNSDSSNIGFLLANERTGESRYYQVAGADEKSAMAAAEGEVQEKGYQASFPSLINVEGRPTYIMVLKDSGGLVKLYATVNVEQYNLVATAATQSECIEKYKSLLGIHSEDISADDAHEITITVKAVRYIDIDGNTYIYLIDTADSIYKAKAAELESLLLVEAGDLVRLSVSGDSIAEHLS